MERKKTLKKQISFESINLSEVSVCKKKIFKPKSAISIHLLITISLLPYYSGKKGLIFYNKTIKYH